MKDNLECYGRILLYNNIIYFFKDIILTGEIEENSDNEELVVFTEHPIFGKLYKTKKDAEKEVALKEIGENTNVGLELPDGTMKIIKIKKEELEKVRKSLVTVRLESGIEIKQFFSLGE